MLTTMLHPDQLHTLSHQLHSHGWCVLDDALTPTHAQQLSTHAAHLPSEALHRAGVGRAAAHQTLDSLRRDSIVWLDHDATSAHACDLLWLSAMAQLRQHLNQTLYLGLNDYEAHYARYDAGAFYGRHVDAFKGQSNRVLSTVYYLNTDWPDDDSLGGELLLYPHAQATEPAARIAPVLGRLVVFLSEDWPHEVTPARRTRHSIAGWFRR